MSLHPCPSCTRHVRATETTCPFCAASITIEAPTPRVITERLGRAALFAFGAALATNAAACSSSTTQMTDSGTPNDANTAVDAAGNPDSGFFPPYGTPAPDTGPPDGGGGQDGGLAGAYGAPPVDSGP